MRFHNTDMALKDNIRYKETPLEISRGVSLLLSKTQMGVDRHKNLARVLVGLHRWLL